MYLNPTIKSQLKLRLDLLNNTLETDQLYDFESVKRFIDEEFISHSYAVFDQMNVKYQSICEQL